MHTNDDGKGKDQPVMTTRYTENRHDHVREATSVSPIQANTTYPGRETAEYIQDESCSNSTQTNFGKGWTSLWWQEHWIKVLPWILLAMMAVVAATAYMMSDSFRTEIQISTDVMTSGDQQRIRNHLRGYGAWGPVISVLLMMAQVVFAPVPASVVQLANGVVYGKLWGSLLNITGQMAGAMMAFWIAQSLGKGIVEKLIGRISENVFEGWLDRWGGKALFAIRAIPGTPSDFISYVTGLTNIRRRTYVLATAGGYIPQSFLFAWLGDSAMGYFWWIVLGGFIVSGLVAFTAWTFQRRATEARPSRDRRYISASIV